MTTNTGYEEILVYNPFGEATHNSAMAINTGYERVFVYNPFGETMHNSCSWIGQQWWQLTQVMKGFCSTIHSEKQLTNVRELLFSKTFIVYSWGGTLASWNLFGGERVLWHKNLIKGSNRDKPPKKISMFNRNKEPAKHFIESMAQFDNIIMHSAHNAMNTPFTTSKW